MTETTNSVAPEIQQAQDMLDAALQQRNAANNQVVQLAAQLSAKDRKIAELEAKIKDLLTPSDSALEPQMPKANGRDREAVDASATI